MNKQNSQIEAKSVDMHKIEVRRGSMGSTDFSWKLAVHPKLPKGKPVAVIVLDGWGEANADKFNCIHVAETPTMDSLKLGAPDKWRLVRAHGTAVGLPTEDDMGNSEVGHNALGAGRIYAQGAKLVDIALATGKIYEGEGFKYIKESFETGTLHLIGLLSDGGVHSRLDQLQLLLNGASEHGAKRIRVHILTDGRDVLDGSSVGFVETLENDLAKLREKGVDGQIASGGGRMYVTMDRYEVRVNLPNGDMVGHTGDIVATVVACKAADEAVKMILDAIEQVGGIYVVTADHGNAEDMVKRNKKGEPLLDKEGKIQILTSHTLQPVPIAIGGPGLAPGVGFRKDLPSAGLANIAATVMNLHGFEAPSDYEPTLIEVVDN
ncbi:hypothetical protein Syun_016982 [Stephania yunnanensis]|uniref:Phosphoglycerate mutase (2,3-diphosphoglycerate-independent) n=1 Tax=Stephania yunnanensis TaxID=152371 RepID=A0AAP0P4H3_9MAGN